MFRPFQRRCYLQAAVLAAASVLVPGAFAGQIEIMSAGTPPPADAPSESANRPRFTVSDDGCFVVFTSLARKLAPSQADGNTATDVFLYEACGANKVTLVSHRKDQPDIAANGRSDQPVISPDGEFVVFRSTADDIVPERNLPVDYVGQTNVFVWERRLDKFELASHRNGDSEEPGDLASQNGVIARGLFLGQRFVAFESLARDLVDNDDKGVSDVFRFTIGSGGAPVDLVSTPNLFSTADGGSFNPAISEPGLCIVYESLATNLVSDKTSDDTNDVRDVFRWNPGDEPFPTILLSHRTGAASSGPGAITGDGESTEPSIADNCERFAFKSAAQDLVAGQAEFNSGTDVFHAGNGGDAVLVSRQDGSPEKTGTGGESLSPILSRDGKWVAYASLANDLAPGQDDPGAPSSDVFVFEIAGERNTFVSHLASDPRRAGGIESYLPEISTDGRYIAYVSLAKDLDPNQNDGNGFLDVLLYNRTWNNSIVASRRLASIAITGGGKSFWPAISGDGYSVAFTSEADDLIADDPDSSGQTDAFLFVAPRDLPFLTARSTPNTNTLEWVLPSVDYVSMKMFLDSPTCPATFSAVVPANELPTGSPPANSSAQFTHGPLAPDTTFCYAIFLGRDAGPIGALDPPARTITGRTFTDASLKVKWALNLADIAALTQVGIGTQNHVAVAQDGGVYGLTRGAAGGFWPASSRPFKVELPIQGRPPVVGLGLLGSTNTTFVGSQDGRAYAFNADRGAGVGAGGALWYTTPKLGTVVQPGASGMFTLFGGLANHILIGARTGSAGTFFALDASNGSVRGAYSGSAPLGAISGAASVDYGANRVYFTSLEGIDDPSLWCLTLTATGFGTDCWAPRTDPAGISGGPVQRTGKVYVGDDFGEVWAFDSATGNPTWPGSYFACGGSASVKGFVLADRGGTRQDLYYSTSLAVCAVTDLGASASTKWIRTTIPNPSTPMLARIGGVAYVFVGSSDGHLYQIEADTPTAVKRVLLRSGSTIGPPAFDVFDNIVYVGSEDGIVYAVEAPLP